MYFSRIMSSPKGNESYFQRLINETIFAMCTDTLNRPSCIMTEPLYPKEY